MKPSQEHTCAEQHQAVAEAASFSDFVHVVTPSSPRSLRTEHSVDLDEAEDGVIKHEEFYSAGFSTLGDEGDVSEVLTSMGSWVEEAEQPLDDTKPRRQTPAIRNDIRQSLLSLVDAAEAEERRLRAENQKLKFQLAIAQSKLMSIKQVFSTGKNISNRNSRIWNWVDEDPVRALGVVAVVQGFISCSILIWALFQ